MNITRGKQLKAQKIVIYGPEGIGKSTFASQFPNPLFIDTEGSTTNMDVARMDRPSSFTMLLEQIKYVKAHPEVCSTLVIDTADWTEQLCITEFCAKKQITGIEDIGYGKGYVYVAEDFGKMLNLLEDVKDLGINVVITAHAQMRKFEQPDELGAYDRWELKLQKKVAPLLKEWSDMLLFANYKTIVVNVDNQGATKGKNKAQGGKRVMYTQHHPCWDAKNRHNLTEEVPFEYGSIVHCILNSTTKSEPMQKEDEQNVPAKETAKVEQNVPKQPTNETAKQMPAEKPIELNMKIPKALLDLMDSNFVSEQDIQSVVASRGYYPVDTKIWDYDSDFIAGVLVGAWDSVFKMINDNRKANGDFYKPGPGEDMPFK